MDFAGVIFFPKLFDFCQSIFEAFLKKKNVNIHQLIKRKTIPFVVKSQGEYLKPLSLGDEMEVSMECARIGETSFTMHFFFKKKQTLAAKAQTIHVYTKNGKKKKLPNHFRKILLP